MRNTVLFTDEGSGWTRVTLRSETYGATTAEEMARFLEERGGMTKGWSGSFDKLEARLRTRMAYMAG